MRLLGEANSRASTRVQMSVNYHVYKDNGGAELDSMRSFAAECGIGFFTSTARAISMENAIQYCREKDEHAEKFEVQEGQPDWNHILPPVSEQWRETMDRLKIPPTKAREMYAHYPVQPVCPIGAGGMFTFIRHDGKTQMCSCTADRRIVLKDYLTSTFVKTQTIRYEIRYRHVTFNENKKIYIEYTYSASYRIPGLKGEEWKHTVADNRLEITPDGESYKILAGM